MDPKPRPNHRIDLETLRRMTPWEKLDKVFELNAFERALLVEQLHDRHPGVSEASFTQILLAELGRRNAQKTKEELAIAAGLRCKAKHR